MARLSVKIGHQTKTCYDDIGVCVQNVNTLLGFILNTIGMTNVIIQRERQTFTFTRLWPHKHFACQLWFWDMNLTIYVICSCEQFETNINPIQQPNAHNRATFHKVLGLNWTPQIFHSKSTLDLRMSTTLISYSYVYFWVVNRYKFKPLHLCKWNSNKI
jgi:hypothetical protein